MSMPYETRYPPPRPVVSDTNLAIMVYALYGVGYFTGISALVGVIIAYAKIGDADPVLHSHYRFLIRTFWIGLIYLTVGFTLFILLVGIPILGWWFIWSLVRIIKGFILINENKPIEDPGSWLFG